MLPDEMREKAIELFKQGMHCSQVLAMVGLEKLGITDPSVIKAMGAFGGGIGGTGNICGALVGAVGVIGRLYSRGSLAEKDNPRLRPATQTIIKNFEALAAPHGGIDCRLIARVDWLDRDQVKDFFRKPESRRQHCIAIVGDIAKALGELLDRESEAMAGKNEGSFTP